jgi:hypothetical protein
MPTFMKSPGTNPMDAQNALRELGGFHTASLILAALTDGIHREPALKAGWQTGRGLWCRSPFPRIPRGVVPLDRDVFWQTAASNLTQGHALADDAHVMGFGTAIIAWNNSRDAILRNADVDGSICALAPVHNPIC